LLLDAFQRADRQIRFEVRQGDGARLGGMPELDVAAFLTDRRPTILLEPRDDIPAFDTSPP